MRGLIGKKIGMTQVFDDEGHLIPVTVVEAGGSGSAVAAPISRRVIQHLIGVELTPVKFGEITE